MAGFGATGGLTLKGSLGLTLAIGLVLGAATAWADEGGERADFTTWPAVEDRFKVAVLAYGGLDYRRTLPEVEPLNFAPRIRIPVLMVNGRYDFYSPVETSQVPLFRLLGSPEKDKRHALFEAGHRVPTDSG